MGLGLYLGKGGIPLNSPSYPTGCSGIGQTAGLGLPLGKSGIPLNSPSYPTWTLGMVDIHRSPSFQ